MILSLILRLFEDEISVSMVRSKAAETFPFAISWNIQWTNVNDQELSSVLYKF